MASSATLKAALRSSAGKGTARKLRAAGQVPAVLYGHGEKPRPLAVNAHELGLLIAAVNVENTLVRLDIEGEGPQDVLLREVQMHAYKPEALHVKIPVRLTGTPVGVHTDGGILDHVLYDLDVECLPGNIPDGVEIDVSNLALGESVRVGDIPPREGVKFLQDAELPIASVVTSARGESEAAEEEAPAEPEVLRARKGDED